jgi:hypothetical protein
MKRVLMFLALLALVSTSGCYCGPRPLARLFGCDPCGGGCGERYYGDWAEGRPYCQDCCDRCGNWSGQPAGYAPYASGRGMRNGYVNGSERWSEEQVVEPTSPADEQVMPQQPTPAPQRPTPANPSSNRNTRARAVSGQHSHSYTKGYPSTSRNDDDDDYDTQYRAPSKSRSSGYEDRGYRSADNRYTDRRSSPAYRGQPNSY